MGRWALSAIALAPKDAGKTGERVRAGGAESSVMGRKAESAKGAATSVLYAVSPKERGRGRGGTRKEGKRNIE